MLAFTFWTVVSAVLIWALQHVFRPRFQFRKWIYSLPRIALQWIKATKRLQNRFTASSGTTPDEVKYPRLGLPPSSMKFEYDVVVIGSGYGGGVAASRMARAGKRVCVLERGAERWPGEYPYKFKDAMREYRVSGRALGKDFSVGKASGLYQTVKGDGQDVFLGNGLGGTSLINAGVFLKAEKRLLESRQWPIEIRENAEGLNEYYARAEHMLQPTPYPLSHPTPLKSSTFEAQARRLGVHGNFYRPPLTTFFHHANNRAGVQMHESTGSGNECTGTNDGSKNSVLATYLADAWSWGAEIFCAVDVKYIRKKGRNDGYLVFYELIGEGKGEERRKMWVRAKELVFLGAGALGTTEILLRSKYHGLATSPLVGQRMSGNGDMLAFAYNCNKNIDSIGRESTDISLAKPCGPTITSCIDMRGPRDASNVRDGYIVQEGAIPEALAPVVQALIETQQVRVQSNSFNSIRGIIARAKSWILGPYTKGGSVKRTMVFLTMSHDENEGTMLLKDDKAVMQWSGMSSNTRSEKIDHLLRRVTEFIGGVFTKTPCLTVHPIGGAVMSNDGTSFGGVVGHLGQLLTGRENEVHEGIVCVDGSIIPTSLGVNPCATITALAERSCDLIVQQRGWKANESQNDTALFKNPDMFSPPVPENPKQWTCNTKAEEVEGVKFEELMMGHLYIGVDILDFGIAEKIAKDTLSSAQLCITVDACRSGNDSYAGIARGTFNCGALSQDPFMVTGGVVQFFRDDDDVADATNLVYDLELLSTEGKRYTFYGYKRLDSAASFSVSRTWNATTTLFTTITRSDGMMIAKGILHLSLRSLLSTMTCIRSRINVSYKMDLYARARSFKFFVKNIASYSLAPFRPLQYPSLFTDTSGYIQKPIPIATRITAEDGKEFEMKIWERSPGTRAKDIPIMLIPGASVNEQIFALPTIPTNAIDYFTSLGHKCYVPIIRFGYGSAARLGDTAYDSRLDVRAAMKYVREREEGRKIYVIAHCLGSIALGIALLNGDVDANWIKGMTCSQVFTNLIFSKDNAVKANSPFLIKVYKMMAGKWFSCHSRPNSSWFERLLDQVLRLYPVGSRRELCNSTVCHRCDVPFGRCWTHANLNHATHFHLGHFFDGIHMNFLSHLSEMGAMPPHHVRTNQGGFMDLVTPENLQRLEGIKICFLSGGDNAVWSPKSTKQSYDVFRETFPEGDYDRVVVQGYGHLDCWMGKNAFKDVFPRVRHHIELCEAFPTRPKKTLVLEKEKPEESEYVNIDMVEHGF
ncbi:hypothetical protein BKA66DRAFT_433768 [Pyrenochaeta sp. MPI-SDFR-AT-0127]|nr:hypothetical protein BKA66DRAFT_433768 [Pyrenochaeta sp. MPI-SDFR-AT-0127]